MKRIAVIGLTVAATLGAANAAEVGRATGSNGDVLILLDDQAAELCPADTMAAGYTPDGQRLVPACWFEAHGFYWVMFGDGDLQGFRKSAFKKPPPI